MNKFYSPFWLSVMNEETFLQSSKALSYGATKQNHYEQNDAIFLNGGQELNEEIEYPPIDAKTGGYTGQQVFCLQHPQPFENKMKIYPLEKLLGKQKLIYNPMWLRLFVNSETIHVPLIVWLIHLKQTKQLVTQSQKNRSILTRNISLR